MFLKIWGEKMEKIKNVKEFVEKLDAAKKVNPKDLSSDQDLTIGIMNLISIEEHLMFSGAETGKHQFYDLINDVREQRKQMMQKIIPSYEGEVWCISKHLLAASMRLFEVGTKALAAGDKKGAYDLFDRSYGLYCIFWGLNMGMINGGMDVKWVKNNPGAENNKNTSAILDMSDAEAEDLPGGDGKMSRLKRWVKNAVNCCIE